MASETVQYKTRVNTHFNTITLFLEEDNNFPHRFFWGLEFGEQMVDYDWGSPEKGWFRATICVACPQEAKQKLLEAIKTTVSVNRSHEEEDTYEI